MKEIFFPVSAEDIIPTDQGPLKFIDSSASIFNGWVYSGRPLPSVSVRMVNQTGVETFIHVTEIDAVIFNPERHKDLI